MREREAERTRESGDASDIKAFTRAIQLRDDRSELEFGIKLMASIGSPFY